MQDHVQVLVLGATGRIGRLLRHCWGVGGNRWQSRQPQAGAGWITFDPLLDAEALTQAAKGCRQILCLAGPVPSVCRPGSDAGSVEIQDRQMGRHVDLALATVRAAAQVGARALLASSAAVYGTGTPGTPLQEDQPLAPMSPYGVAKARMEREALGLAQGLGVPVTALRIGNIAGFDAILGGWKPGFRLDQFSDGSSPRRSYIGLTALADVLAALLASPDLPPILNVAQPTEVGGGKSRGSIEMAALLRAAGHRFTPVPAPQSAIPEVALDLSRLSGVLAQAGQSTSLPVANAAQMVTDWTVLEPYLRLGAGLDA
ncbi:MAG: NAD(P)-dependent oxidoreductase [Epibacterium sp.]|nr:NAD(P)-dependent oxidoreductase [Epibacterium sp.]NQX74271.1 NAD(P)-dependent oxidoreductase [Epibacterium sp.]